MFAALLAFSLSAFAQTSTPSECTAFELDMKEHIMVAEHADRRFRTAEDRLSSSTWLFEAAESLERDRAEVVAELEAVQEAIDATGWTQELEDARVSLQIIEADIIFQSDIVNEEIMRIQRAMEIAQYVADEAWRNYARVESIFNDCLNRAPASHTPGTN